MVSKLSLATIVVSFSLVLTATAQDATVKLSASHSGLYGTTAQLGFRAENFLATNANLSLSHRQGALGHASAISITGQSQQDKSYLTYGASFKSSDWDKNSFASDRFAVTLKQMWQKPSGLSFGAGVFARYDGIQRVAETRSGILERDIGPSKVLGGSAHLDLVNGDFSSFIPSAERFKAELDFSLGGAGDRKFASVELATQYDRPISERFVFRAKLSAGVLRGLDKELTSISDRFFLGASDIRGFEANGIGPRDTKTGAALGGAQFYNGSLEVLTPLRQSNVIGGAFVDFGSLWNLPGDVFGIDSSDHDTRASIGLSIYTETKVGALGLSWANPLSQSAVDKKNKFAVTLDANF